MGGEKYGKEEKCNRFQEVKMAGTTIRPSLPLPGVSVGEGEQKKTRGY